VRPIRAAPDDRRALAGEDSREGGAMTAATTPARPARRRRTAAVVLAALVALAATGVVVRQETVGREPAPRPGLQQILDSLVTGRGRIAPGATAYVHGPRGTWTGSAGLADVSTREPMRADARMRLESVSKIWTATLVLQLAQQGKLRLGDTVDRWLPGLLPYGDEITVGQLLTHRSGIVDNNDIVKAPLAYIAKVKDAAARARFLQLGRRFAADPSLEFPPSAWIGLASWQPLLFPPGSDFHYSNIGFELLGLIAARASGEPVPELYRGRILEPLRLERTAYDPQGPIAGSHAHGYAVAANGTLRDATSWHGGIGAEGGLVSDAEDTAAFLTALMQGRLLETRTLTAMKRDAFWSGGEATGCGIAYGHSGAGPGFKTNVWVSGDGSRVAVLLLNGRSGDYGDSLAGAALRDLYCKG
jgi:D-alanyl-D-alanine carboxypeptidase